MLVLWQSIPGTPMVSNVLLLRLINFNDKKKKLDVYIFRNKSQNLTFTILDKFIFPFSGCGGRMIVQRLRMTDGAHGDWQTEDVFYYEKEPNHKYILVSLHIWIDLDVYSLSSILYFHTYRRI